MKKLPIGRYAWLLVIVLFFAGACKSTIIVRDNKKPLPPGQMKKVTGSQSAAPYAPGQQKKKK